MRFAVLASGHGLTLQALLDAESDGQLAPAEIVAVVCNRPRAHALIRARHAGKPAILLDHKRFDSRDEFDARLLAELSAHDVQAVVLAGFMRLLGRAFIDAYPDRIINVHPSLLPAFPGLRAPAQAIEHGVRISGCTVHFVDIGIDTGPIIAQASVLVEPDDDTSSLHARIKLQERQLLPRVTSLLARGALTCEGRVVRIHQRE